MTHNNFFEELRDFGERRLNHHMNALQASGDEYNRESRLSDEGSMASPAQLAMRRFTADTAMVNWFRPKRHLVKSHHMKNGIKWSVRPKRRKQKMTAREVHSVKSWPVYFQDVIDGKETFEVRFNDRNYCSGDILIQEEYDPSASAFTGRWCAHEIGQIWEMPKQYEEDLVAFMLLPVKELK